MPKGLIFGAQWSNHRQLFGLEHFSVTICSILKVNNENYLKGIIITLLACQLSFVYLYQSKFIIPIMIYVTITKTQGLKTYLFKMLMKFHDKKLTWIPEDVNLEVYLNQKDDSNIAAKIKCINQDIFSFL